MTFQIGDEVQLKGGRSPVMTITGQCRHMDRTVSFTCTWFDGQRNEKTAHYPPEALSLYREERVVEAYADHDGHKDFMTQ